MIFINPFQLLKPSASSRFPTSSSSSNVSLAPSSPGAGKVPQQRRISTTASPPVSAMAAVEVPKNNKTALLNNISDNYKRTVSSASKRIIAGGSSSSLQQQHKYRKIRPPRDCRISEWSDWSACSKTCGIGEMHRYRKVVRHAKRGGRPCPPLQESKWCGSARDCNSNYFQW